MFVVGAARAEDPYAYLKPYESFDYSHRLLQASDLERMHHLERDYGGYEGMPSVMALVRGIVFGKRGRIFHEKGIQEFLKTRSWYRPDPKFTNAVLTPTERRNIDLIRGEESKSHWGARPGDLRFWQNRPIPKPDEDMGYTISDLRIMQAEIEAIHGKTFPSEPLLQKYFDERYWYKRDPGYRFSSLNKTERANLRMLAKMEQGVRGTTFSPTDVILYADKRIPAKLLKRLSLHELRLTRNAIYAMRGRPFQTPWLHDYFGSIEWYSPLPLGKKETLTPLDSENLKTVVATERALHEELTSKPIPHERLTGLFVEDLRKLANEIPARHGKVFTDRAMRNYFSSFPWYKPDPKFSLSKLSPVEKKNYAFLLQAAKDTTTQFNMEEG